MQRSVLTSCGCVSPTKRSMPPRSDFWCFSDVVSWEQKKGWRVSSKRARQPRRSGRAHLGEEGEVARDLCDNLVGKDRLDEDDEDLVLLGEAVGDGLRVDLGVGRGVLVVADPLAESVVRPSGIVVVIVVEDERRLELRVEGRRAGGDGLLARVDGPVVVVRAGLDKRRGLLGREDLGGACLDLLGELVVAVVVGGSSLSALVGETVRAGGSALLDLALLALGRVLEDEGAEAVAHVDVGALAARLAVAVDEVVLGEDELRLGVLARAAEDVFVDEAVEEVTQAGGLVDTVDDVALGLVVEGRLGAQL